MNVMAPRIGTLTGAALVLATVAAGILGTSSPAVAYYSAPLLLEGKATPTADLLVNGVAVKVRLKHRCIADNMWMSVTLSQAVKGTTTSGTGSATVQCDGHEHMTTVTIFAGSPGPAYTAGKALAQVDVGGCFMKNAQTEDADDDLACGADTTFTKVTIGK
jgi:hypothetical protein